MFNPGLVDFHFNSRRNSNWVKMMRGYFFFPQWLPRRRRAIALERLQAGVARRILKASWKTPKTVLLRSLQWSSLMWRREITCMTKFHDLLCTRPPHLAQSLFPFSRSKRQPRRLVLPLATTARYKNFFFIVLA